MRSAKLVTAVLLMTCACAHRARQTRLPQVPAVVGVLQRQVVNAIDAGEGDLALAALRRRLAAEPDNLALRLALVRRYREDGFAELALEHARLAAERFPESAEIHIELARSLRALGLTAQAAAELERFYRAHPQASFAVPAWLGILRDELGQWQQGEAAHRAALVLAPDRDELHNNLGYNLYRQGRLQEARESLERALALNANSKTARNNLGLVLAALGRPALEAFRQVSDPATAHNNLACALIEQGKTELARRELESALGYNRSHPAALANLRLIAELDGQAPAVAVRAAERLRRGFWSRLWAIVAGVEDRQDKRPQR